MTLASIREGDIVRCDVRGDRFIAFAGNPDNGELMVHPIGRGQFVRIVKARQVIEHWRKSRTRTARN